MYRPSLSATRRGGPVEPDPATRLFRNRRRAVIASSMLEPLALWLDETLGLLTPAPWDAWRNWLATIGGLLALFVTIRTYRRNVQLKNEEQARKVYAEIVEVGDGKQGAKIRQKDRRIEVDAAVGLWERITPELWEVKASVPWRHYKHAVTNGSDEIIGPVTFTEQHVYDDGTHKVVSSTLMVLKPGDRAEFQSIVPGSSIAAPRSLFLVTFRDSGGRWWDREGTEAVRAAKEPRYRTTSRLLVRLRRRRNKRLAAKNRKRIAQGRS